MLGRKLVTFAQRFLSVFARGDSSGSALSESNPTFELVARDYMAVKAAAWGAHAADTATSVIRKHLIGHFGPRPVNELTAEEIQRFVDGMVRNNASHSLLHKVVAHLRAILDYAAESGLTQRNPMRSREARIQYESQKQKSERYLTLEECRALLAHLRGRDQLIVRMFIQLGLHPEELFALRRNDVDSESLRIDEVFTKGELKAIRRGEASARVYLPPNLRRELRTWKARTGREEDDWLFPASRRLTAATESPMNPRQFRNRILKPAAVQAGIPDLDLRTLRRTCAAHFGRRANAQDTLTQMRHNDSSGCQETHQTAIPKSLREAALSFESEILCGMGRSNPMLEIAVNE